jgi:hypothetical protein
MVLVVITTFTVVTIGSHILRIIPFLTDTTFSFHIPINIRESTKRYFMQKKLPRNSKGRSNHHLNLGR